MTGLFLPLTSPDACEKSNQWLWKESSVSAGVRKPGNTYVSPTAMIIMTLAVKVVLNPNTTNQPSNQPVYVKIRPHILNLHCLTLFN